MDNFEAKLGQLTDPENRRLLGAIGLVVNGDGTTVYSHASGFRALDFDAPILDSESTFILGSAGKFITHIAALQLVEQGALTLDEPIYKHLPELKSLPLIRPDNDDNRSFTLIPATKSITLRHLLSHTSGLASEDHPLITEYQSSDQTEKIKIDPNAHKIVQYFSNPLIFEPGEGFCYGHSIYWTQLLVTRLGGGNFAGYVQEHIFERIGMNSSTYQPNERPDIYARRLRMVRREDDGTLSPADGAANGLLCSATDIGSILSDLVSGSSRLLNPGSVELLFTGQLAGAPRANLREDDENYAFCAGKIGSDGPPSVNWSFAGLVAEEVLPISQMPEGTVSWEGMPNVLWAMNREKKLGMFFGTQLVPVGDETANGLALMFIRDAWKTFSS